MNKQKYKRSPVLDGGGKSDCPEKTFGSKFGLETKLTYSAGTRNRTRAQWSTALGKYCYATCFPNKLLIEQCVCFSNILMRSIRQLVSLQRTCLYTQAIAYKMRICLIVFSVLIFPAYAVTFSSQYSMSASSSQFS